MTGLRVIILLIIAALGSAGTLAVSQAFRDEARRGWELEAEQSAQWLSGTLLAWLEESYAPLSGLAALSENSSQVTESEFLNAFDGLEARATAFFLDAAAFFEPVPESNEKEWRISYSSDADGILSAKTLLADQPQIKETISVAQARFGELILGQPITRKDGSGIISPVALGTFHNEENRVIVGLVDYSTLVKGLFDLHVPPGVVISLKGRFPEGDGQGSEKSVIAKIDRKTLHSVTTRTVSAGAELEITWHFDRFFSGGIPHKLADLTLISGLIVTALLTLIIGLLQQTRNRARAAEATSKELEIEIAQRAVAEEGLQRMSKVFMDSTDPIVIEDLEGNIIDLNNDAVRAYGWTREELLGNPLTIIVPPERHDQAEALLHQCLEGREVRNVEGLRWNKDGKIIPVLITLSQLTDAAGKPVAVSSSVKDISDLKEAEAKLQRYSQELEQRVEERTREMADALESAEDAELILRDAIESISEGFVIYDKDDRMVICNEQYKNLFPTVADIMEPGVTFEELIDTGLERDQYGGETGQRDKAEIKKERMENHLNPTGEGINQQMADGRWMMVRERRTSGGGIAGIRSDITDLKKAEEELRDARDAAEGATKAKSEFLAAMSHEIRTPMNGIVGMIDLLRETDLDTDQRQMMGTVRDSAFSLLQVINDILDFSKIEAGKLHLESIPISVRDAVEGVCETLAPNAAKKDVTILAFVDPEIPDWVEGGQVRLRQVLFNMGGNAVKFTETEAGKKGIVVIRADLDKQDGEAVTVKYSIIDNGIGIPPDAQEKLFEAFTQAESSTTRRFGGTGLGLSICARLSELMNGALSVDSELGQGSTFSVTLPHKRSDKKAERKESRDLSGVRVLIVTPTGEGREIVERYLTHSKATVTGVDDIEQARATALDAAVKGEPFHTVVLSPSLSEDRKRALREDFHEAPELADTKYIFLEPGRRRSARQMDEETIIVDASPVHRAAFLTAVAITVGRASPEIKAEEEKEDAGARKAPTVQEAERQGRLILVAEDNLTNQDVILRQLNLLGYAAEIYDDGKQAFEAWQKKSYAILLSDCHMPVWDGFQLTAAIRESQEEYDARFPIIAITANALQGEADRCLAAGMDDYLSKPLEMSLLRTTLKKWMPASRDGDGAPIEIDEAALAAPLPAPEKPGDGGNGDTKADSGSEVPVDLSALRDVFGDDEETLREILQDFVEPATNNVKEITDAFDGRAAAAVGAAAHKLKSSSRAVGAHRLADLCQDLEKAGKSDDWENIDKLAPQLNGVLEGVVKYIGTL